MRKGRRGSRLSWIARFLKVDDASKVEGHIGQKVTVTGSVDGDTIKVESVKAAD